MFAPRTFAGTTLFVIARLAPLLASLSVGAFPWSDAELLSTSVRLLLMVSAITCLWYMIEGLGMVWLRARDAGNPASRGYGFVSILATICLCALLALFRAYGSRGLFLLMLVTLSVRGMSRSGWERERPQLALACSLIGATGLAIISFLVVSPTLFWQSAIVALCFGSGVTAVEASWFSDAVPAQDTPRWLAPTVRASLYLGPLAIASLGVLQQLPRTTMLLPLLLPFAGKIIEQIGRDGGVRSKHFPLIAGYFLLFVGTVFGSVYY